MIHSRNLISFYQGEKKCVNFAQTVVNILHKTVAVSVTRNMQANHEKTRWKKYTWNGKMCICHTGFHSPGLSKFMISQKRFLCVTFPEEDKILPSLDTILDSQLERFFVFRVLE